jgi:hypothetical protein
LSTSLFDLWEISPSHGAAEIAFSAAESGEPLQAVWRMDLHGDAPAAEAEMANYFALAQASEAALDDLPARLESLLVIGIAGAQGVAFAAEAGPADPEAALLSELSNIERASRQVSFAVGEDPLAGWREAYQAFQETANRLLRAIAYMAWVETRLDGRLLGRTRVSWTGDTETVYLAEVSPGHADLHRRSLEVAVVSRNILLRAFAATLTGAAKCSVLIATPGGALLAVPTVWKYIQQILSQLEQYQALNPAQVQPTS